MHNGRVLDANDRIKISDDGLKLHIKNSQKTDNGIFQCFASNTRDQAYGVAEYLWDGMI